MTIAVVQSNQVSSSGTVVTCAFLSANAAGNAIIAGSRIIQGGTPSFTDNNNNGPSGYHVDVTNNYVAGGICTSLGSAANIVVSPHNPITVAFDTSISSTIRGIAHEVSGLAHSGASTVLDGTQSGQSTNTAPDTPTITTTNANDLLMGLFGGSGVAATVSAGNMGTGTTATLGQTVDTDKLVSEYRIVSSTSSAYHGNFSLTGAEAANALIAAYQAAAAGFTPLAGGANDTTTAQGSLTNYASVVLTAPLYTGPDSIVGPNAIWSGATPVVGSRVFYDPTFITIHTDGEITSTSNNCQALAQFFTGSTWSELLIVITPNLVSYASDTTSASGALQGSDLLNAAATDTTSASGTLKGTEPAPPTLIPSTEWIISTLPRAFEISLSPRAFSVSDAVQRFDIKDPSESVPLTFNFAPDLASGETLSGAPTVSVTVATGTDANPTELLNGTAGFDAAMQEVIQPVTGGLNGVEYEIVVTCATSNPNKTLTLVGVLPVRR